MRGEGGGETKFLIYQKSVSNLSFKIEIWKTNVLISFIQFYETETNKKNAIDLKTLCIIICHVWPALGVLG